MYFIGYMSFLFTAHTTNYMLVLEAVRDTIEFHHYISYVPSYAAFSIFENYVFGMQRWFGGSAIFSFVALAFCVILIHLFCLQNLEGSSAWKLVLKKCAVVLLFVGVSTAVGVVFYAITMAGNYSQRVLNALQWQQANLFEYPASIGASWSIMFTRFVAIYFVIVGLSLLPIVVSLLRGHREHKAI